MTMALATSETGTERGRNMEWATCCCQMALAMVNFDFPQLPTAPLIKLIRNILTFQDGSFVNGVCSGLGIMNFPDGSKYEKMLQ